MQPLVSTEPHFSQYVLHPPCCSAVNCTSNCFCPRCQLQDEGRPGLLPLQWPPSHLPAAKCRLLLSSGNLSYKQALLQIWPLPVYARKHWQVKPPCVLLQAALWAHPEVPLTHSSMSMSQFGPSYLQSSGTSDHAYTLNPNHMPAVNTLDLGEANAPHVIDDLYSKGRFQGVQDSLRNWYSRVQLQRSACVHKRLAGNGAAREILCRAKQQWQDRLIGKRA